jgi:ATP synthase protein I
MENMFRTSRRGGPKPPCGLFSAGQNAISASVFSTTRSIWFMSSKGSGTDNNSGSSSEDAALRSRLDQLSSALSEEKIERIAEQKAEAKPDKALGTALGTGLRVSSELVAGVLVGGFIGWWIDRWLGTSPFGMIGMLLLGMASGFWNVYRIASRPTGPGTEKKN